MGGAEANSGQAPDNEEDEMSEDGSVNLEGESSDEEVEEEEEEEGKAGPAQGQDDAMEVDDQPSNSTTAAKPVTVAS